MQVVWLTKYQSELKALNNTSPGQGVQNAGVQKKKEITRMKLFKS